MNKMKLWLIGIATALLLSIPMAGYAATVDKTGSTTYGVPASGLNKYFTMSNTVDISAATNGDVYQVLPVGTGTMVFNVRTKIITPNDAATTSTIDIGDGTDTNGYSDDINMKAAATVVSKGTSTDAYVQGHGKEYTTGDTIDLTFTVTGTNTAGEVKITALCLDLN
mgnify:FL=1